MLPIINILLIVGILLFILYNLYIDTRNWSNTGSFLEGMENASSLAEYMGAFGGPVENYSFSSADEAKAKCEAEGLQLCTKEEVIAGAKSKASLENVCSAGWTTDAPRGWYSVKGRYQCGTDNNWNTWAPPSGKGSAHCCKPVTSAAPAGSSEELKGQNGSGYRGNQTKTRSGKTCMNWTSQDPHSHSNTPEKKPNRGLGDHNYCRNPSEPVSSSDTIWCYTTDPNSRWEYCDPLPSSSTAAPTTYFKTENNQLCSDVGKDPITTSSECKEAAEKLNLTWSNDFNGNGDHPNCLFSNDGRSKVHFNTSSTPGGAQPNYQSLCKNKPVNAPAPASAAPGSTQPGAGSAEDAIENQVRSRAGNVAPMGSNVPQNCKKGCVAPTGPSGNCKVIQKDGVEKRECDYGCPVPSFIRGDTVNCKYDRDCNSCGTVLFNPDDPPQMPPSGRPVDGVNTNSWVGSRIDVPGIQNAPGLNPGGQTVQGQMGQGETVQVQMGQGQMGQGQMANNQYIGELEMSTMDVISPASVATSSNAIFDENIMKQVLENKDLIPSDLNTNNEETSLNSRIGKKFMIDTATIRNFALPNIEENDYIELGRIVKSIKMREKDPQEIDQVKVLYEKLNKYVLELLTDSSLDTTGYNNNNIPKQLNNKTRTTGMFGENSNSLISNTDTHKNKRRSKVKSYNSLWSLYG